MPSPAVPPTLHPTHFNRVNAGSDGLWDNVSEREVVAAVRRSEPPHELATRLAELAERHARDPEFESPYIKEALSQGCAGARAWRLDASRVWTGRTVWAAGGVKGGMHLCAGLCFCVGGLGLRWCGSGVWAAWRPHCCGGRAQCVAVLVGTTACHFGSNVVLVGDLASMRPAGCAACMLCGCQVHACFVDACYPQTGSTWKRDLHRRGRGEGDQECPLLRRPVSHERPTTVCGGWRLRPPQRGHL
eukprot:359937-Chlamydomonas_euryale.AAC.6